MPPNMPPQAPQNDPYAGAQLLSATEVASAVAGNPGGGGGQIPPDQQWSQSQNEKPADLAPMGAPFVAPVQPFNYQYNELPQQGYQQLGLQPQEFAFLNNAVQHAEMTQKLQIPTYQPNMAGYETVRYGDPAQQYQ
jgi:hypothetical protein